MILEPGPDLALPFEADMSGLGLVSVPPEFRRVTVARVLDASPALEAGIEVGDEIETVNGKPVAELGVAALRERLRQEGQDVRFELLRGAERIALAIRTRRLI
jgi:C-terminal processing protease CtpA/Prc